VSRTCASAVARQHSLGSRRSSTSVPHAGRGRLRFAPSRSRPRRRSRARPRCEVSRPSPFPFFIRAARSQAAEQPQRPPSSRAAPCRATCPSLRRLLDVSPPSNGVRPPRPSGSACASREASSSASSSCRAPHLAFAGRQFDLNRSATALQRLRARARFDQDAAHQSRAHRIE